MKWDTRTIKGSHRFLNRVWILCHDHLAACEAGKGGGQAVKDGDQAVKDDTYRQLVSIQHNTIKQVRTLIFRAVHCSSGLW